MNALDDVLQFSLDDQGCFSFQPDPTWGQGRTVFGGVLAAAALRALTLYTDNAAPARTVTTTFEKAVASDAPVEGRCSILYQGKRVSNAQVLFTQEGEVKTRVSVLFGLARASTITVEADDGDRVVAASELETLPYFEGIAPAFTQHVDFRWTDGPFPFTGGDKAAFAGWCRWKEAKALTAAESILGLLDAWASPVLALSEGPIPASSIVWTAHLFDTSSKGSDFFHMSTKALVANDGYATCIDHLHDEHGKLVAWSEQLVAYFT